MLRYLQNSSEFIQRLTTFVICLSSFYLEIYATKTEKRMKNKQMYEEQVYSMFNICIIIKKALLAGVW